MKNIFIAVLLLCSMLLVGCTKGNSSESIEVPNTTAVTTTEATQETTTSETEVTTEVQTTTTGTTTTTTQTDTETITTTVTTTTEVQVQTQPQTVVITKEPETIVVTEIVKVTEAPTQKEDHSYEIEMLENKIAYCDSMIETYNQAVSRKLNHIISCENEISEINSDLELAKVALENAKNQKVRVYDGGWKYEANKDKVDEAQRQVDRYQGRIDMYNAYIEQDNNEIANYNSKISELENTKADCQAKIDAYLN